MCYNIITRDSKMCRNLVISMTPRSVLLLVPNVYIATSSNHHRGKREETGQQPAGPEDHLQVRGALEDVHGIGFRHTARTNGARQQSMARATTEDQNRFLCLKQGRAVRVHVCSSLQSKVHASRVDMHRAISVGVLLKGSPL